MRGLLTLVAKEWRDVRAVTAASAVLVVVACLAVRWYLEERYGLSYADFPSMPRFLDVFVPGCAALYAMLIAADVVGGEVASRRIDLVELLPAGRGRVWAAKALFVVAASAAFTLWCVVVQWGVLLAIDGAQFADPFVTRALGSPWVLGLVATFAAATLLVSTMRLRGLAATLVGGAAALGLWGGTYEFSGFLGYGSGHSGTWFEQNPREWIAALWLPPALLAAAGLAYRSGRVHLGKVLRPATIALGILVAALAGPGAALAYDALTVVPGRPGTSIRRPWPSPDGRFIALLYVNEWSPSHASKVFVLDTERSVLVEPEVSRGFIEHRPGSWEGAWDADGSLVIHSPLSDGVERAWVDPATGAVRRRVTQDHREYGEESRRHWESYYLAHNWRLVSNRRCEDGGPLYEASAAAQTGAGRTRIRTWAPATVPMRSGRLVYFPEPNVLAARTLPDGEERRLLTSREPWRGAAWQVGDVSTDGRLLLVEHDGGWKALDLETGETTALPPSGVKPYWWQVYGDASRRLVVVGERKGAAVSRVVDLASGALVEFPAGDLGDAWATADGRIVVQRANQVLDLLDRDLKLVRRLWPLGKE